MKVIVFNAKKYKRLFAAIKVIALVFAVLLVSNVFIGAYTNSDSYAAALQLESERRLIIIDAGHGGEDPGAVGVTGDYEKDLNLAIAKEIGDILISRGYAVLYTRTEDKLLYTDEENVKGIRKISDLKNRCKIAAEYPEATFISIHMNSYASSKYSGLQVYYSTKNEESYALARSVQERVKSELQPDNNRKIKEGKSIYVLENIDNTAILIECGFLTNPEECKKLSEKEYQKQLSLSIVYGIIEYVEK